MRLSRMEKTVENIRTMGEYVPMLCLMKELADKIRERRGRRGSVNFDFPETKITLDELGRPVEVKPYERNDASKIIEDFMLMANETVAEAYFWLEIPSFTGRTMCRTMRRSASSQHLSIISVIISTSGMK